MNIEPYIGREFDPEIWNCWTLCKTVLENEAGIIVPSFAEHYSEIKKFKTLAQVFKAEQQHAEMWGDIAAGEERQFDIVLLRKRSLPIHVGIVTRPGYMLHVEEDIETVEEPYRRLKYKHQVVGFYRWARGQLTPSAGPAVLPWGYP